MNLYSLVSFVSLFVSTGWVWHGRKSQETMVSTQDTFKDSFIHFLTRLFFLQKKQAFFTPIGHFKDAVIWTYLLKWWFCFKQFCFVLHVEVTLTLAPNMSYFTKGKHCTPKLIWTFQETWYINFKNRKTNFITEPSKQCKKLL